MEKISTEYNIGFTLKMEKEKEKDDLYNYIKCLDREYFLPGLCV